MWTSQLSPLPRREGTEDRSNELIALTGVDVPGPFTRYLLLETAGPPPLMMLETPTVSNNFTVEPEQAGSVCEALRLTLTTVFRASQNAVSQAESPSRLSRPPNIRQLGRCVR